MIGVDNIKSHKGSESNCTNCHGNQTEIAKVKDALSELNYDCSDRYRSHEDDTFKIKELEITQFKLSTKVTAESKLTRGNKD
jgi:hypothetical protein